jgi:hypothetical protein
MGHIVKVVHIIGDIFHNLAYKYTEYFFIMCGTNSTYRVELDVCIQSGG